MSKERSLIRRIAPETDREILRIQSELIGKQKRTVSYVEASRVYAITSFNGKTDLMVALRKMDRL